MATLGVQDQITNVAGGTYFVRVQLFDTETGALVSEAVSTPIEVPASEPLTPQVQVPLVQLRVPGQGKAPGAGLPGTK